MRNVLITGGTGSFGHAFVERIRFWPSIERICVLSRDELKQSVMREEFRDLKFRTFLGDVRDRERLVTAFAGIDTVIHAAALKQVPAAEYDPWEFVQTNVIGSMNVLEAARSAGVERVLLLSTDKACSPCTLYGATKLTAERLFTAANSVRGPISASTRYGNVCDSRGSVIPLWREQVWKRTPIKITHPNATRFHMSQDQAVDLVLLALSRMRGGEVFVPWLQGYRVGDLANVVAGPDYPREVVGLRETEKLHEALISEDEVRLTRACATHLEILPAVHPWTSEELGQDLGMVIQEAYRSDRKLMPVDLLKELVA